MIGAPQVLFGPAPLSDNLEQYTADNNKRRVANYQVQNHGFWTARESYALISAAGRGSCAATTPQGAWDVPALLVQPTSDIVATDSRRRWQLESPSPVKYDTLAVRR